MKVRISTLAGSILVAFFVTAAWAQGTPPAQPAQSPQTAPSSAKKPSQEKSDSTAEQTAGQGSDRLPEMKTQAYPGTLVDASCAGSGPATAGSTASTSSADRSAAGAESSCTVSSGTTRFALKMKDGNTVRFDDVGNERAQLAMKSHKKWSDSASANKPIRVKVNGILNGDKLTVLSVD